ncbi:MAG: type IV secretory system conjugative DNA transfer family protein [Parvimonas sp.]|uniref:VirD4-like conjugal transfer protein, CD1115 family n=1 Tax=Parvimonas sp. TaxID=1944660 RepID=UPI002A74F4C1|nr:type IV secretory system conjugative DNA transfer family protein [Parvimonas sp.]MDY3050815.1 type IV secretory system conjugative DNA transfer family protein [Parvimonas sp.]
MKKNKFFILFLGCLLCLCIMSFSNFLIYSVDFFIKKFKNNTLQFDYLKAFLDIKFSTTFCIVNLVIFGIFLLIFLRYFISKKIDNFRINRGQHGTNRFTTLKEIQEQYKAVPELEKEYKGNPGVVISRYKNKIFIDDSPVHNLVIGMSRSGKGELWLFPTIDIISRAENKPSMIFNDPKLELASACYDTLIKRGYDVEILNLINPERGLKINPLQLIIDEWKRENETDAITVLESVSNQLFKQNVTAQEEFWIEVSISLFNAVALNLIDESCKKGEENKVCIYSVIKFVIDMMTSYTFDEMGNQILETDEDKLGYKLDEYFSKYDLDYQPRLMYSTFADTKGKTRAGVLATFKAKLRLFSNKDIAILTSKSTIDFEEIGFIKEKYKLSFNLENSLINDILSEKNIIFQAIIKDKDRYIEIKKLIKNNKNIAIKFDFDAITTKKIILKISLESIYDFSFKKEFVSNTKEYEEILNYLIDRLDIEYKINTNEGVIYKTEDTLIKQINYKISKEYLLEFINLDITLVEEITKSKPKAIFMGIPDFDKSKNLIATLFLEQAYFVLAKKATLSKSKACDRDVFFGLEELGQLPVIKNLPNMVSMSLSKRIKFIIVIQSFIQLKELYKEAGTIIKNNCSNIIFIATNDKDTAKEISEKCGDETIIKTSKSGNMLDMTKRESSSSTNKKIILAQDVLQIKQNETIILRTLKRTDLKGNKIIPYPIFNRGETELKPRFEYLSEYFDTSIDINYVLDSIYKNTEKVDLKYYTVKIN